MSVQQMPTTVSCNQEKHWFMSLTCATIFIIKSHENQEGIFITLVVFLKAWIFHAALFPSDSKDANQIYHGPSRENNLWILRQSEIYLLHHQVHQHIFYSHRNGNFPKIRTLESGHIILLEWNTHESRCTRPNERFKAAIVRTSLKMCSQKD